VRTSRPGAAIVACLLAVLTLSCDGGGGTGVPRPTVIQMREGNDQSGVVGSTLDDPFVVEVLDSRGRAVGGKVVAWNVVLGGGTMSPTSSVTNALGEARAFLRVGTTVGAQRVHAVLEGLSPVEFESMALARPASILVPVSGGGQDAMIGTTLPQPLVVQANDQLGAPVAGVLVNFSTTSGTVQPTAATTGADGRASTTWQLGLVSGAQTVSASAGAASTTFSATVRANAPTSLLLISGGGQSGIAGALLPTPIVVRLLDALGAPAPGRTVLFNATTENGLLTPTAATTDANGEASAQWRLGGIAGTQTVGASSAGVPAVQITATAGPAAASALALVSGNNQSAGANGALPLPVVVKVRDAFGNGVSGRTVTFTPTAGHGTFSPTSVVSDDEGLASAAWTLGDGVGNRGATASVAGVGTVLISAVATPPLYGLSYRVVDAEYHAATNRLVIVSANPSRLHIVDPETRATRSVDLPQVPNAVSIRRDGAFAAVGHNAWISYVDLAAGTVDRVYPATTDVIDLVLADSGWVHAFPRTDQWETIRSIRLSDGAETRNGTIRAGTIVRMHPSGDYIYGANNGLSPSDFEKYDIRSGAATVMYDSPYHGDYDFGGNVWISEDGLRLFARSGNAFRSSAVRAEDILYAGNLGLTSGAQWISHSTAAQRVVALPAADWNGVYSPTMRVYDSQFLAFRGSITLPAIAVPGVGSFPVQGRFSFHSADGQRTYVLVRADGAAGMANDWALAIYAFGDLP